MKKIITLLLVLTLVLSIFAACGSTDSGSTDAGDTAATGNFKVASHNAVIEGNAYRAVYEDQMTEQVKALQSAGLIGEYNSFVANNDPAIESSNIEMTINEGYDIIIVNPIAASGLDALIQQAYDAGIVYINADCEYDSAYVTNVVVDQTAWASIQAEWLVETMPAGSKIIQFNGVDGNSANELRNAAWVEILTDGGMEIVKTVAHLWSDTESKQLMSEIIASGIAYDGIINQEAANGILDAIEEAGVAYPGCITSSEEIAWIKRIADLNADEEVLPFIVVENPPGIGATALAVAVNLALGEELASDADIYYTPEWIMTYDNMDEMLLTITEFDDSSSVSSYLSVDAAKAAYFK